MDGRENLPLWPADRVERRPLSSLVPYANNARTHTAAQVAQVAASMREWGWTNPVLVDEAGGIIAGHCRVLAAGQLGFAEAPVMVAAGWTEVQKRAYVLADNQLALNAAWDGDMLSDELRGLGASGFDLELTGFADLDALLARGAGRTDPDEVPPVPDAPVSALGDVWLLGLHRLVCGDCTTPEAVAAALGGGKPHLMVTDPPYGVDYDPDWRNRSGIGWSQSRSTGTVKNDDRSDWGAAFALFAGDVVYCWAPAGPNQFDFYHALTITGFVVRMQIIWAKPHFPIGRGNYHVQNEPCWYAIRKAATAHWSGSRKQTTLWQIDNFSAKGGSHITEADLKTGHGTQKPVECMRRPIENNSRSGDAVYDPFVGSGTTIIAAEMTGRTCQAIELSPAYVDCAVIRWQTFTGGEATLEATGQTYAEVAAARIPETAA